MVFRGHMVKVLSLGLVALVLLTVQPPVGAQEYGEELSCDQACKELGYDRGDCSIEGDCLMLGYPSCYGGLCIFGTTLETGLSRSCEEPQVCCCSYEEPCGGNARCTLQGCSYNYKVFLPMVGNNKNEAHKCYPVSECCGCPGIVCAQVCMLVPPADRDCCGVFNCDDCDHGYTCIDYECVPEG